MIKVVKVILLTILIFVNSISLSGCWNYREIDKMSIVAGLAVDKSEDNRYLITVEIVDIKGGMETKIIPKYISMDGDTLFDTVRNIISISGKSLFWSHTKVLILSQAVISDDIAKILDWLSRDIETRIDINILVSKGKTAKEILETKGITNEVVSYELDDMLRNENNLSKAPVITIGDFIVDIASNGIEPIAPVVGLVKNGKEISPQIMGAALFTKYKLISFLNSDETKYLLFVRDLIRGGLIVQAEPGKSGNTKITLEIFNNKTNMKPVLRNGNVEIQINIETIVGIDEIQGMENFYEEETRLRLEKDTEKKMNNKIEVLVRKVQSVYGTDVFGFGEKIKEDLPNEWRNLEQKWKEKFKDLKISVNTKIHIKHSGELSKSLPIGD